MRADELEKLEEMEPSAASDPIAEAVRKMMGELGEDPAREGILKTPERVAKSLRFLTSGYTQNIDQVLNGALYSVAYDEMVIVRDIEVFSLCEHHLLPFFGRCHVAYVPNGRVIGLSKIPRLVDVFARRLQVQERLTVQVAETIMEKIRPQGVGIIIEARHLCMIMRGVEKQNSVAVTSHMLGVFRDCEGTRSEFLRLVRERT
jgi:GTP cyclohydrolase I